MRRETPPTPRLLLRALLALALMLNGTAIPAAGATGIELETTAHGHHHAQDSIEASTPAGDPAHAPATDCCDGKACDCGCIAPQMGALRQIATSRAAASSPARPAPANAPYASSLISTPFRPPA